MKNNDHSAMHAPPIAHQLIDTDQALVQFRNDNADVAWLCFDTEFVGEKRYQTRLCLIQVTTPRGNYLIDPFPLSHLDPFLDLLRDPAIPKITHAGDNDYRLLHALYGLVPANVWDTQIASGMLGYRYPTSLSKLVENELRIHLKKGYAVTDWEDRPFSRKQLDYALDDVIPLRALWESLEAKLQSRGRLGWVQEECNRMALPGYYARDPYHEALNSNLMRALRSREQVFLMRLFEWRRSLAEEKDHSKEMVLPSKLIGHIVKAIRAGADALRENRRVPDHLVKRHGATWEKLYNDPITPAEKAVLAQLPSDTNEDDREEVIIELLYLLMKYRSQEEGVSHQLVMPRNAIRKMKNDNDVREEILGSGWRRELLGDDFIAWLQHFDDLQLRIEGGKVEISF